ncbi:MATE family efflux transporter [Anaerocolumna sp. AGMB13025]|uniref:MATE family efflux transporter n=1 Tax=Anaerocolumna sp. AGMB13025 TaxID=3039116 RepID=UPI00241EAC1E|nr:MATE family efflux transporter [Anaerocolumna sp. AGMB13025]WFR59344.1 MATE family efflux transporter [Anaerocolumna sp. AGMB13025]
MTLKNDFSQGSIVKNILNLAFPMTLAQLINVLYNVIDRIYIGRISDGATLSLTAVGLTLPIISIIMAFANLFGMGGAPLCSIARGRGDNEEAEQIMGNSFLLLLVSGVLLTVLGLVLKKPMLYLFGASDATFPYANEYLTIYLLGNIFVMIGLGMNSFINSQGFGKIGMMTVLLGAITNIILDPIFIFTLHMGVKGAAIATVISQFLSAAWILLFLTGKKTILKLRISSFKLKVSLVKRITLLGLSGFMMSITNGAVQIMCNASLKFYGGDLYVGVMTVINSIREIISMPVSGLTNGAQPVMGYNYGAGTYDRVRAAIKFMSVVCITYTFIAWGILNLFPHFFIQIFSQDTELLQAALPSLRVYFFGFFMMSLQFAGQSVFVALGKAKQAVFFSLLRKVIIVIPLTLLLPMTFNLGTTGVFLAEPISNFIGGTACFTTMLIMVRKELKVKTGIKI